jgi:hypothetical protein
MFKTDLAYGQDKEVEVARLVESAGGTDFSFNDNGDFDFRCWFHGRFHLVEVKCEDRYSTSGNISVEVLQGKVASKPSGLHVSKANLFVHTLKERCVIYERRGMTQVVARRQAKYGGITSDPLFKWFAQADNGNGGYIIPTKKLSGYPWFQTTKLSELASSTLWRRP